MLIEVTWTFSPAVNLFFFLFFFFPLSMFNSHNSNCKLHLQSKYSLFLRSPSVSELGFLVSINQASCITSSHHWHSHLNPSKVRPEKVIFQEQTANPYKEVGEKNTGVQILVSVFNCRRKQDVFYSLLSPHEDTGTGEDMWTHGEKKTQMARKSVLGVLFYAGVKSPQSTISPMGQSTDNTWMISMQLCTPSSETPPSLHVITRVRKAKNIHT